MSDRFWRHVEKTQTCWLWTGWLTDGGYGRWRATRAAKSLPAHRVAYEIAHGPVPAGLVIDHLCRVRRCVNPAHLEAVTFAENVRRGISFSAINGRRRACPQGHEYDRRNGRRRCLACETGSKRQYVERHHGRVLTSKLASYHRRRQAAAIAALGTTTEGAQP